MILGVFSPTAKNRERLIIHVPQNKATYCHRHADLIALEMQGLVPPV
jgi:hypothetical protein